MPRLSEVVAQWNRYELDDEIYCPVGAELTLDTGVEVLPFDRNRPRQLEGSEYLLGIEQVRDAVEALEQLLGRTSTGGERLKAVLHYSKHDAFIEPHDL